MEENQKSEKYFETVYTSPGYMNRHDYDNELECRHYVRGPYEHGFKNADFLKTSAPEIVEVYREFKEKVPSNAIPASGKPLQKF